MIEVNIESSTSAVNQEVAATKMTNAARCVNGIALCCSDRCDSLRRFRQKVGGIGGLCRCQSLVGPSKNDMMYFGAPAWKYA